MEQRDQGHAQTVVASQLEALAVAVPNWHNNIVIAYEPVWAIGTGRVATTQQAQDMHMNIRHWLMEEFGETIAKTTRIIYGGKFVIF